MAFGRVNLILVHISANKPYFKLILNFTIFLKNSLLCIWHEVHLKPSLLWRFHNTSYNFCLCGVWY